MKKSNIADRFISYLIAFLFLCALGTICPSEGGSLLREIRERDQEAEYSTEQEELTEEELFAQQYPINNIIWSENPIQAEKFLKETMTAEEIINYYGSEERIQDFYWAENEALVMRGITWDQLPSEFSEIADRILIEQFNQECNDPEQRKRMQEDGIAEKELQYVIAEEIAYNYWSDPYHVFKVLGIDP